MFYVINLYCIKFMVELHFRSITGSPHIANTNIYDKYCQLLPLYIIRSLSRYNLILTQWLGLYAIGRLALNKLCISHNLPVNLTPNLRLKSASRYVFIVTWGKPKSTVVSYNLTLMIVALQPAQVVIVRSSSFTNITYI